MNFVPVITHALAILLGWLVVSFSCVPKPGPDRTEALPSSLSSRLMRSATPHLRPSPRALLAAQAEAPMDPGLRATLKRRILDDWASTDPDGLLRHLEGRPWPPGTENAADRALHTIALTRPADLLAYAKREGCGAAIDSLITHGDPRLVLDLLLAQEPGAIIDRQFAALFARGCELDPSFHECIDRIEDPEARFGAFMASAATLLDHKRDDVFFPWLARQLKTVPSAAVVSVVVTDLVRKRSDVARLARLPDTIRNEAVRETLREFATTPGPDPEGYQLRSLKTFLENGWLDHNLDLACLAVNIDRAPTDPDDLRQENAAAWKDWALELPRDAKWDRLRYSAIHRWALQDPTQWSTIADLPSRDLRDAAYAATLRTIDLSREAGHIPWILGQINDPALRDLSAQVLATRLHDDQDNPTPRSNTPHIHPRGRQ